MTEGREDPVVERESTANSDVCCGHTLLVYNNITLLVYNNGNGKWLCTAVSKVRSYVLCQPSTKEPGMSLFELI
jgi:hypothetical protein